VVSEAHPRKQRGAVPGLACVGDDGWLPRGVVPSPPAGASFARASRDSLPRATYVYSFEWVVFLARRRPPGLWSGPRLRTPLNLHSPHILVTSLCRTYTPGDSRFTIHDSRFTIHDSRFTIHDSRFTIHDSLL